MSAQLLALANDRLAAMLAAVDRTGAPRIVHDPATFRRLLVDDRPRVVICGDPPATPADVAFVAEQRRRRPTLRAILVDAPDCVTERLEALASGFDDAMPETMDPLELAGRVALQLSRATSRSNTKTRIPLGDGLVLDLAAHELRRDRDALHLRPKELRLLALLATHPGRVYTRRQLLDRVWGADHEGDPRTIDVHVAWLRAKLESDPDRPARLVTVRGIGYRLDLDPA
jgi:DNA-binding response OmpR family regulator